MKIDTHRRQTLIGALISISLAIVMVALFLGIFKPVVERLETIENKLYDFRFHIRGGIKPSERVVIIAVDDESIKGIGHWPWSRENLAALVDRLYDYGAKVIVLDILLSEEFKGDKQLRKSIDRAGNVLLPMAFNLTSKPKTLIKSDELLRSSFAIVRDQNRLRKARMASDVLLPIPYLSEPSLGLGHVNIIPDFDGTLRWEILYIGYGDNYYPSLSLQAARAYLGMPREAMVIGGSSHVQLGEIKIPTDIYGRMLINYLGPEKTIRHIPAIDVIKGKIKGDDIRGKIAIVGITALGIYDLRVTPFSENMAGVEKYGSVIENILDGSFMKRNSIFLDSCAIVLMGVILSLTVPRMRAIPGAVISLTILLSYSGLSYYLFVIENLWIDTIHPLLTIILGYSGVTVYRYAVEEKRAKQVRQMFSSYVSPKIVDQLIKNPDMARLGGERRVMTVLFSDIRGFTTFSERHTPEEVVNILNEYLGEMTEIVFKHDGTLDKFVGDAIVAFWGAPLPQEDHAERALRCALHMVARIKELQKKWISEGKVPLDMGIGMNTGEMIVGNMGAERKKMDYTVIGDNVNLAARIEGLTRQYNTHIIITEYTYAHLKELFEPSEGSRPKFGHLAIRELEAVKVKGKERPVIVYEVVNLKAEE